MLSWLPIPPRRPYRRSYVPADLLAAVTTLFLAVPSGLAYATIAGLPPAVGLYAASVPTIVSSVFRSSSHVLSGPTNAVSLLVGGAVAAGYGADPVQIALTLAFMIGVIQTLAGALRLGAVVDFISSAVVLGYITGAGVLIGVGQLPNATGTPAVHGRIWDTVGGWIATLPDSHLLTVQVSVGTVLVVVAVRWLNRRIGRRIPSAIVAMTAGLALDLALDLESRGLRVVADLAEIPAGLPPVTLPDFGLASQLLAVAVAGAVLSLVESTSVARSLASRTGQRLDASGEFFGQGLSNVAAAFFGGYPVSGSLSRSVVNERVGAKSRVAGIATGVLMLLVLVAFGPLLNHTPVPSLAGLLFVVAYDLVDIRRIRHVMRTSLADALSFSATMIGTWVLSLDLAIYLGVAISLVLFLRRARLVKVAELLPDATGRLVEHPLERDAGGAVRILHVEGPLFFGAAGELRDALMTAADRPGVRALVVRLKRATGLDATTATTLAELASLLRGRGQHLILVGLTPDDMDALSRSGAAEALGDAQIFPTRREWFSALRAGVDRACELTGETHDPMQPPTPAVRVR